MGRVRVGRKTKRGEGLINMLKVDAKAVGRSLKAQ
jgi:hypothetical protein